jgi:hypothetical protein
VRESLGQKIEISPPESGGAERALPSRRAFIAQNTAALVGYLVALTSCGKKEQPPAVAPELPKLATRCPQIFSGLPKLPMDAHNERVIAACADSTLRTTENFKLAEGLEIARNEIGTCAYKVQPGDSIAAIVQKLCATREFSYLRSHSAISFNAQGEFEKCIKIRSFNISSEDLRAGSWIPIPGPENSRIIPDRNFMNYAFRALELMTHHPKYGSKITELITNFGSRELLCTVFAIAKQESGLSGKEIGSCELHRYEPHHNAFSYSHFHVLNVDAGRAAFQNLGLTGLRCSHPINGVQLCLAFFLEKTGGDLGRYLPLPGRLEEFAVFYNGAHWKKINPHYIENIAKYYAEGHATLEQSNGKLPVSGQDRSLQQFIETYDPSIPEVQRPVVVPLTNNKVSQPAPGYTVKAGDSLNQALLHSISAAQGEFPAGPQVVDSIAASLTSQLDQMFGKPFIFPGDHISFRLQSPQELAYPTWHIGVTRKGRAYYFPVPK